MKIIEPSVELMREIFVRQGKLCAVNNHRIFATSQK